MVVHLVERHGLLDGARPVLEAFEKVLLFGIHFVPAFGQQIYENQTAVWADQKGGPPLMLSLIHI